MTNKIKEQAIKRPWKVGFKSKLTDQTRIETLDGKSSLGNTWGGCHEENARLIVHCVNNFDEVVEALKFVKSRISSSSINDKEYLIIKDVINIALKKAGAL